MLNALHTRTETFTHFFFFCHILVAVYKTQLAHLMYILIGTYKQPNSYYTEECTNEKKNEKNNVKQTFFVIY